MNNECSNDNKCVIPTCTKPQKQKSAILVLPLLGEKNISFWLKDQPDPYTLQHNNNQETVGNFLRYLIIFYSFPHNSTLYSRENQISFITTFLC